MEKQQNLKLKDLEETLKEIHEADQRIQHVIQYMEQTLSQADTPQFKQFWHARTLCLEIMKQEISPIVRTMTWEKFTELTDQARRLKEHFEEESSFAEEQFRLAITAVESDLEKMAESGDVHIAFKFEVIPHSLKHHAHQYKVLQKDIALLNAFAERIHSLRRDLTQTNMRVSKKNQLFKQLSLCGDKVFPIRKELIEKLSDFFIADVEKFIKSTPQDVKSPLHQMRDEIKVLQSFAKELTLNQAAFKKSRHLLGDSWNTIKGLQQARRLEQDKKIEHSKQLSAELLKKIQELTEGYKQGTLTLAQAETEEHALFDAMKNREIGKPELHLLREASKEIHDLIHQAKALENSKREEIEKEHARKKQEQMDALKANLSSLEISKEAIEQTEKEISRLGLSDNKEISSLFAEKKEALFEKLENEIKDSTELKGVLEQRVQQKNAIKNEIDRLRKLKGASGLDFQQQMENHELMQELKTKFDKIEVRIKSLEKKLA